jgi:hypothetical protein
MVLLTGYMQEWESLQLYLCSDWFLKPKARHLRKFRVSGRNKIRKIVHGIQLCKNDF